MLRIRPVPQACSDYNFVMSVCLSVCLYAWNHSAPTESIFVKLDTGSFY